jgi:diguanylate cyclase (GGDEF)-like protein
VAELRPLPRSAIEFEAEFRESRVQTLISLNLNTFWSIGIVIIAFGLWDYYADPVHSWRAFSVRLIGSVIVTATGLYQNLPGRARALLPLSKVRLVAAAISCIGAAALLDRGYGFGVAGLVVIVLTGPYSAIDSRDLLMTNVATLAGTVLTLFLLPIDRFAIVGTIVFLTLSIVASTLLGRILEASNRRAFTLEIEQLRDARTDHLTGLDNRRAMQERGRREVKLSARTGAPVSVILCDLDHFKNINDDHGHEAGDEALVKVARVLRAALRESDALGRWGGEEFIAVLPATDAAGARDVAERMRLAIEATRFEDLDDSATISLGVATSQDVSDPSLEWDLLIKEADQRLYRAKHEGRNRVVAS